MSLRRQTDALLRARRRVAGPSDNYLDYFFSGDEVDELATDLARGIWWDGYGDDQVKRQVLYLSAEEAAAAASQLGFDLAQERAKRGLPETDS